jgi:hypothetical protein
LASNFCRADVVDDDAAPARLHLRVDRAGEVDVAEHFQLPGVTPGGLVDLVDRTAGDVAGIVDENVDVTGFAGESCDVLGLAQVDDVGGRPDLMRRAQPLGKCFQCIAAAGRQHDVTAFLGKGFGCGRANALRCAGDQDTLAAQVQIHGETRLAGGAGKKVSGIGKRQAHAWSTLQCSVARQASLVHCRAIKQAAFPARQATQGNPG